MQQDRERPAPFTTSYIVCQEDKRANNRTIFPALKNNAAAGYKGSVKKELLKAVQVYCKTGASKRKIRPKTTLRQLSGCLFAADVGSFTLLLENTSSIDLDLYLVLTANSIFAHSMSLA